MFHVLLVLMGSTAQDTRLAKVTYEETKVKRDTDSDMEGVIQNLSDLTNTGDINTDVQEGQWYVTTEGEMMQYAMPDKDKPVKLIEAVKLCKDRNSKLWDEKPQRGTGFSNIKRNEDYWISDHDGSMAKYTAADTKPEIIYDDICTQVQVKTPTSPNEKPKIEVKTVFDTVENGTQGCNSEAFKGLTLCLRPVKEFDYANSKEYRDYQTERKTLIKQEDAARRLQEIKTELTANNYRTSTEKTEIPAKLKTITDNIEAIKREDQKTFPNFKQIKTKWVEIIDQMQDLERMSARIASEYDLKQLEDQMEKRFVVSRGKQVETELDWTAKWHEIAQHIENNKNSISSLETKTGNETAEEVVRDTEHEEEGDEEDDQEVTDKVEGYFLKFFQKLKVQQQSFQEFCTNWKLDCRIIALGGMVMTMIGAGCHTLASSTFSKLGSESEI